MPARQVRLDADVTAELQRLADEQGGSVASHANRRLRAALSITARQPAVAHDPDVVPVVPQRATVSGARPRLLRRPR